MKKLLPKTMSLGAMLAMLCGVAAMGCADGGQREPMPAPAQRAPTITLRQMQIDGCQATAIFDIESSEAIEFVALDRSDLASVRTQISTLDESGREILIEEEMHEVDSSLQSLLERLSDGMNARERSVQLVNERTSQSSSSNTTENSEHVDSSSSQSTSTSNSASSSTQHSDAHRTSRNESASNGTSASDSESSSQDSQNSGGGNTSGSAQRDSDSQRSSESASSLELIVTNERLDSQESASNAALETSTSSAFNRTTRATITATNDSNDRTSMNQSESEQSQNQQNERQVQNEVRSSRDRHLVSRSLETLRTQNIVLRVEMTADETHEVIRVFQGANREVRSQIETVGNFTQCRPGGGAAGTGG